MHKVVVERPRWSPGLSKGRRRGALDPDLLPRHEGMRQAHTARKEFTDLLGPLCRWLQSQVGRPWNAAYSEACAVIKPDSVIRAHIKTHLLEFVVRHTFLHEGKVCTIERWGRGIVPIDELRRYRRQRFYVHPVTGLLHPIPAPPPRPPSARDDAGTRREPRWLNEELALFQRDGLWFEGRFEAVPGRLPERLYDHRLGQLTWPVDLPWHANAWRRCVAKRQLSHAELRRHGLGNEPARTPSNFQREGRQIEK